jgi:hypothetical protein
LGAIAGGGLCALELGRLEAARIAASEVEEMIEDRPNWFQGREIAEALIIRVAAASGDVPDALSRFDRAVGLADASDIYNAAWLTAICAEALRPFARDRVNMSVIRYYEKVRGLGYPEMTKRYEALTLG